MVLYYKLNVLQILHSNIPRATFLYLSVIFLSDDFHLRLQLIHLMVGGFPMLFTKFITAKVHRFFALSVFPSLQYHLQKNSMSVT